MTKSFRKVTAGRIRDKVKVGRGVTHIGLLPGSIPVLILRGGNTSAHGFLYAHESRPDVPPSNHLMSLFSPFLRSRGVGGVSFLNFLRKINLN